MMRPDFFRTFVQPSVAERKTAFQLCRVGAERPNIMDMEKTSFTTSQIWRLSKNAMLISTIFTLLIPAITFAGMCAFDILDMPARYHGIMNYFIVMMFSIVLLYGVLNGLSWGRSVQLRWLALAALFASLWAVSGVDMEYILAIYLSIVLLAPAVVRIAAPRRLGMICTFCGICLGATVVHHAALLSSFTNPITQDRMIDLADRVLEPDFQAQSCAVHNRFEVCEVFDDRFADNFTTRDDFRSAMAALREQQNLEGRAVSTSMYDKNDDIPVWAFGYDGQTWRILMSHDDLYTQRVVPAMGMLWWLSVVVWTGLGVMTISWHELGSRKQRRATTLMQLSVYSLACGGSSLLISLAVVLGKLGAYPSISPGDWMGESLVHFWYHVAYIAIAIPIIWLGLGAVIYAAHRRMILRRSNRHK